MNYATLQTQIATRLGELNTNPLAPVVDVVVLPENEADYKRSIDHAKPRITVAYTGSEFGTGKNDFNSFTIDDVAQEETVNVQIEIHAKKLYGNTGLYAVLNAAQALLLGFSPTHCDKLHFRRSQLQKTEDGLFFFVLECVVKTYALQPDPTTTAVLVTQINYQPI